MIDRIHPPMRALLASMPLALGWDALVAGHLAIADPDDPAPCPNQMRLLFSDRYARELNRDRADEAALALASLR